MPASVSRAGWRVWRECSRVRPPYQAEPGAVQCPLLFPGFTWISVIYRSAQHWADISEGRTQARAPRFGNRAKNGIGSHQDCPVCSLSATRSLAFALAHERRDATVEVQRPVLSFGKRLRRVTSNPRRSSLSAGMLGASE